MAKFPNPVHFGPGATRWRLSEIVRFEAARTGEQAPALLPEQERYLRDQDVANRLGVSRNTVWRWSAQSRGAAQ